MTATDTLPISLAALNILRHAIGYAHDGTDNFPKAKSDDERRNRFITDPTGEQGQLCTDLVARGLMADNGPLGDTQRNHFFHVTDEGKTLVRLPGRMVRVCSYCKREFGFTPCEARYDGMKSHGCCPECFVIQSAQIEAGSEPLIDADAR